MILCSEALRNVSNDTQANPHYNLELDSGARLVPKDAYHYGVYETNDVPVAIQDLAVSLDDNCVANTH